MATASSSLGTTRSMDQMFESIGRHGFLFSNMGKRSFDSEQLGVKTLGNQERPCLFNSDLKGCMSIQGAPS